jgi:hypothetical protein
MAIPAAIAAARFKFDISYTCVCSLFGAQKTSVMRQK